MLLWFVSGNRDDRVFGEPFGIDLGRGPNPHMSFGCEGRHECLRMWLARLELRVVLQELLQRVSRILQPGPEAHLRLNFINGIERLPAAVERR